MNFSFIFLNPIDSNGEISIYSKINKNISNVQSASGIFSRYLFANVIRDLYDNGNRKITIQI